MSWLTIITTGISLISNLLNWLNSRQLLDAGADQEIARQLAAVLAMTQRGKQILDDVHNMNDKELEDWLKELGKG